MPIIIPQDLPAAETLIRENIFVMNEIRAIHQDIRPLKIAIVNLMPNKSVTETQLLRLLSNFPLQIQIDLITMDSYQSKNTPAEYLKTFYKSFADISREKFDGMIITGAPVEKMRFGDVSYWSELKEIMDFTRTNVTSTFHICWAAQAALYHHYGVHNHIMDKKVFGVFKHHLNTRAHDLVKGFDDEFYVPHSRWTEINREELDQIEELEIIAESDEAGIYLVVSKDGKYVFSNGHCEYDVDSLNAEYTRDLAKGMDIDKPKNYYPDDDPKQTPRLRWRGHGNLLFSNWLNYYVYQVTPYNLYE